MFHLKIILTAIRGLLQNPVRSILATLGVAIGVGAVVSAVSILEGAQRDILDRFESLGADQLIIFSGTSKHGGRSSMVQSIMPDDASRILSENEKYVKNVSPQFQASAQIKYLERNTSANLLGAAETYAEINSFEVVSGRFIRGEDVRGRSMVCVLGHGVAEELFGSIPATGKSIKINGKGFHVIGVMEPKGTIGFMNVDDQVIVPVTTAMGRLFGSRHLSMLIVQCINAKEILTCIDHVKATLRENHRIQPGQADDFTVYTQQEFKDNLAQVAKIFGVVLYSIAGISIIVGAIGIMNIMLVSVTERTREIGVRVACGARRFDILKQFLTEASIISIFGGGMGVVAGWAIASFLGEFTQVLKTHTPPGVVVLAIIMAGIVGIASGIYPAIRAARLDPVSALRFE